jgi:glyoxylase-like metal-dependent hydrolase (beta-lactamase superfamily II)
MKIFDDLHAFLWLSPTENNCNTFFIDGKKRVLIDPGHEHLFGHVREGLAKLSLSPDEIDIVIITHGHPDHMEGVKVFAGTSTIIAVHASEMEFIRHMAPHYGEALGISDFEPGILLKEGHLKIGELSLEVIQTPGHSPGSICLYRLDKKVLFTGDVVFNQGIGRTDLPGGSGEELKGSIKRISGLDTEYLLPGHGDIVTGRDKIKANFEDIERNWFPYL